MQFLTMDEVREVLRNTDEDLHRVMFLVAFWHGLRASEVCALTGAQIADGYIDVKRLKGSLRTRQPYMKHDDPLLDEATALAKLAATAKPRERLFPFDRFQFHYRFAKAARLAGLPKHKQHPHCLKHSCAVVVIPAGIEVARQWLGHKTISSTGEYLKITDEIAATAVKKIAGSQ